MNYSEDESYYEAIQEENKEIVWQSPKETDLKNAMLHLENRVFYFNWNYGAFLWWKGGTLYETDKMGNRKQHRLYIRQFKNGKFELVTACVNDFYIYGRENKTC